MKLCILEVLHEPFDKRVYHKVARSLVEAGHDVTIVTPWHEPLNDAGGVRFAVYSGRLGMFGRLKSTWRLVQLGRGLDADAYVAVEPESWVSALLLKLLTGRRVVFDVHEHVPSKFADYFPAATRPTVEWLTLRVMRLMGRATDLVILTRNSFQYFFEGLSIPCVVVINTNHLQPPCADVPEELRRKYAACPTIIHQGLFGDIRGSWQLLDAMKLVSQRKPGVKCIVLGHYIYGDAETYRKAIDHAGLGDVMDMIPAVPFDEVPAYIAVSKAGLILFQPGPSNHTLAMPHKLFDYMREGVPVIAPDFALEVKHIVDETGCGLLVDVTKPEAIAEAICHLLDNPSEAHGLGENGRRGVETKYNWQIDERILIESFAALEKTL